MILELNVHGVERKLKVAGCNELFCSIKVIIEEMG